MIYIPLTVIGNLWLIRLQYLQFKEHAPMIHGNMTSWRKT